MTQTAQAPADRTASLHLLLLRLAGRLPDELITLARGWLADGQLVEVAQAVVFSALTGRLAMSGADIEALEQVLSEVGEDTTALAELDRLEVEVSPPYGLAPVHPELLAAEGDRIPYSMDLTVPYAGPGGLDAVDAAAAAAVSAPGTGAAAVWRVWRFPARHTQWPPARRIYLVQAATADGSALSALAAAVQAALAAAGEVDPQVEVFADAGTLPAYQRTALGFAALVWTAEPATPIEIAGLLDDVSEDGAPVILPEHPRLTADERDRVLGYLDGGVPLLISADYIQDVVERDRGEVVPVAFRTDGRWIWTDGCAYYLTEYGLAPDEGLLAHIRSRGYEPPDVDAVALHRALAGLYSVPTGEHSAADQLPDDRYVVQD
jgi:hypothetical protein